MKPSDVINHLQAEDKDASISQINARFAVIANVSVKTVYDWISLDSIPIQRQALIQVKTNDKLKMR